jgi:hypothetical protein
MTLNEQLDTLWANIKTHPAVGDARSVGRRANSSISSKLKYDHKNITMDS